MIKMPFKAFSTSGMSLTLYMTSPSNLEKMLQGPMQRKWTQRTSQTDLHPYRQCLRHCHPHYQQCKQGSDSHPLPSHSRFCQKGLHQHQLPWCKCHLPHVQRGQWKNRR